MIISFLSILAKAQERKGGIEFTVCKSVKDIEGKENCNEKELKNFFVSNFRYPEIAIKNRYEGKTIIKYSIATNGSFEYKIVDENQVNPSLNQEILNTMQKLKVALNSGKIKAIPATVNGKSVSSEYLFPVVLKLSTNEKPLGADSKDGQKKIIIVTYRTSEKTIQFRRDVDGNIYAYSLSPAGEKQLIEIKNNNSPEFLTEDEKFYIFLYNLTFLKSEILITLGELNGEKYEIFIDKDVDPDVETSQPEKNMKVNVYLSGNGKSPVETFPNLDQLFLSKYSALLFK